MESGKNTKLTVVKIKELLKKEKIPFKSKAKKAELLQLLNKHKKKSPVIPHEPTQVIKKKIPKRNYFTVGELKRELANYSNILPIIYSHDDEGNYFQYVMNLPGKVYFRDNGERELEILQDATETDATVGVVIN